jgi:hypothetical protein
VLFLEVTTELTASPKHLLSRSLANVEDYCLDALDISAAQELFRFSKSEFFRFRHHHRIESLPGLRIHLLDIVNAFEAEREIAPSDRVCLDAREYASLLLKRSEVEAKMKVSRRTSCRFRSKHKVPALSGGFVHSHDLIAALDAERLGLRAR